MYIKNKTLNIIIDNNDNVNTNNNNNNNDNNNKNNNNNTNNNKNKRHYKQGEKKSKDIELKQAKIFKQIIMTSQHYPPTFLPCFSVLNPPEKQL